MKCSLELMARSTLGAGTYAPNDYHYETIKTEENIDERQLAQIMEMQDLHDVRIEYEPIGYLRISGQPSDVSITVGKTHNIIYGWERERHRMDVTIRQVSFSFFLSIPLKRVCI